MTTARLSRRVLTTEEDKIYNSKHLVGAWPRLETSVEPIVRSMGCARGRLEGKATGNNERLLQSTVAVKL